MFWLLLASCMAHEAPSENVSRMWVHSGFFWQDGWFIRLLLKMCPVCECVLASSGKLANEAPSENVSREYVCSGFFWQAGWLISLLLKMCPGCECVLASSGKLHGSWGFFWKCVQLVSVFCLLLATWMAHEASSENMFRQWVCFSFFWQAAWPMGLLLMCPESECVLVSSGKLDGSWGPW